MSACKSRLGAHQSWLVCWAWRVGRGWAMTSLVQQFAMGLFFLCLHRVQDHTRKQTGQHRVVVHISKFGASTLAALTAANISGIPCYLDYPLLWRQCNLYRQVNFVLRASKLVRIRVFFMKAHNNEMKHICELVQIESARQCQNEDSMDRSHDAIHPRKTTMTQAWKVLPKFMRCV